MTQAELMKMGIALAACWAIFKYAPGTTAKAAAVAVGAVIVAKKLPYVGDALA